MGGAERVSKALAVTYICSCSARPPPNSQTARQLKVPGSRQQLERGRKECEEAGGWWAIQVSVHCVPVPDCPPGLGRARWEMLGCDLAFLCSHQTSPTDNWLADHRLGAHF